MHAPDHFRGSRKDRDPGRSKHDGGADRDRHLPYTGMPKALGKTSGRSDAFSDYALCHLRRMSEQGCSGNEIAAFLRCSPLRIRAKACSLGLRLRPERGQHELKFMLTVRTHSALREIAKTRNTSPSRLAKLALEILIRDRLLESMIDRTVTLQEMLKENARVRAPKRIDSVSTALRGR
jgi:hypothetical protein